MFVSKGNGFPFAREMNRIFFEHMLAKSKGKRKNSTGKRTLNNIKETMCIDSMLFFAFFPSSCFVFMAGTTMS